MKPLKRRIEKFIWIFDDVVKWSVNLLNQQLIGSEMRPIFERKQNSKIFFL